MPTSKTRRSVQLPVRLHTELKDAAQRRELTVNALLVVIVREWLDVHEKRQANGSTHAIDTQVLPQ